MANQIRYQVGFDVNTQNLNQLKSSLQEIQKLKISDVMKFNDIDRAQATKALIDIKDKAKIVEDALREAFNQKLGTVNIETFNKTLKETKVSISDVYNTFSKAGVAGQNAFRNLASSVLTTNIQLKETHGLLDKMATTLANTIKWNAASAVVNGFSRSIEQAWGYVKALDTSLNDIRIVTGKSSDEMAKFAVQANNAAKELGKTTTDYTEAALIYAQQGLSDEQIQARAAITLKAASVTGQSTDAVSEQLTAVWNGYKVTADEAQLYVDRLAAVAATTASDLEELSTGMSKVASAAAAMGVGQDQLAAQLSTIISVTRQAPESVGTALRTVYARISDIKAGIDEDGVTLGNYSGKMAELGFNVLDMNGNLRDMGEVMEEIGNKWSSLTREQQVSLAQTMAGQRQYSNLIALFDNFEKYNEALATAQGAAGTLQEQQDVYMDSTAAHLQVLKASMEDIYDSLADTDSINSIIDALSSLADFTAKWVDSIDGGMGVLKALGTLGLTVFSQQIAKGINTTISNFQIAKENANQFNQALEQTKEWQGIPGLDEAQKQLLSYRQQLLELSKYMSPEQFTEAQTALNDAIQSQNKKANLMAQKEILNEAVVEVTKAQDAWTGLNQVMNDPAGQEKIIERISNQEKAFLNANAKLKEYTASLKEYRESLTSDGTAQPNNDEATQKIKQMKTELQGYIDEVKKLVQSGQMAQHKGQVEQLEKQLNQLDDSIPANQASVKLQQIGGRLQGLTANAGNAAANIRQKLSNEFQGTAESIGPQYEGAIKESEKSLGKFQNIIDRFSNANTIDSFSKLAGGIGQVAFSIQQLQNLGDIWKNQDLTRGQKVTQTITNLLTSLPMLINGIYQASTGLSALLGVSAGPIGWILLGITAIAGITTAVISKQQQARKQAIQDAKANIEQANAIQENIQAQRGLYSSLDELQKKYEQHEITRNELKSQIEDLIAQYGLQGQAADQLRHHYDDLKEAILEKKKAVAEEAKESAQMEAESAEKLVAQTAATETNGDANTITGQYSVMFSSGRKQDTGLVNALSKISAFQDQSMNGLSFSMLNESDDIVDFYHELNDTITQYTSNLDQKQKKELKESSLYKDIIQWLESMEKSVEVYDAAMKDYEKYSTQLEALKLPEIQDQAIESVYDYMDAREALKDSLKAQLGEKYSDDQLYEMVDAQLARNYRDKFIQFDEYADKIKQWEDKFNGEMTEGVKQALESLDEQHLNALFDFIEIDPQAIDSWDTLLNVIQKIAGMDLSNLAAVNINKDNFQDYQRKAAQTYNQYQGIQDTVRSGKNISTEDFDKLSPDLQSYFKIAADGTYKLVGDAEKFYETVNSLKLDGFTSAMNQIENRFNKVANAMNNPEAVTNQNYEELTKSAVSKPVSSFSDAQGNISLGGQHVSVDYDHAIEQAEYLKAIIGDTDERSAWLADKWLQLAENEKLTTQQAEALANKVTEVGDYTGDLSDELAENTEMYKQLGHQMHDAMFPTDEDVDASALNALSDTLQDIADESDDLADSLSDNSEDSQRAAEDLAESVLRFDDAIKDVSDNYDDWMDALTSGNLQKQAEAVDDLRDAYSDLLDLDGTALSEDFLTNTENLELMKAAAQGSEQAYDKLMEAAGQDIATQVHLDTDQFQSNFDDLMAKYYQGQNLDDMQIGASLNDAGFLAGLTNMVNAAGMTAQQATDYLASMGVDAEVVQTKTKTSDQHQYTGVKANVTPETFEGTDPVTGQPMTYRFPNVSYDTVPIPATDDKENTAFSLRVISANKSSGGGFKFQNASNAGGGGGGKKGGGGGGGGGGGAKPDTSKKEKKKPKKRTADPYHDVNRDLKKIDRSLQKLTKDQDKLFGKQYIDNLNKQNATLQKSIAKLKEKQKIQKQDLKNQRQTLKNLGVTFDKYGNITNYQQILTGKQSELNQLIAQRNELVQKYNKSTDKAYKQGLSTAIKEIDDKIKQGQDALKQLEDGIKQYENIQNEYGETNDALDEAVQKQIENNIKKFRYSIEIRLDMGEAARDWNEFVRKVIYNTDVLKDTEFDSIFGDAQQDFMDLQSYFGDEGVGGSIGAIEKLTNQLAADFAEINEINKTGWSDVYGKDKAQAMEHLVQDWENLMQSMEQVEQLVDNIDKAYLDTIDDIADQFDKQIEGYDFVNELIQHDIDLLQILYGDENYAAMDKYYNKMLNNQNKQIDSLRKQADFQKQQRDAAIAAGQTNAAEKFEENYKRAIQNINSAIQDGANLLKDKYTNTINLIFDELDNKLTKGKGFDYLNQQWQYMKDQAQSYLDTIDSAYELQSLQNKFQKALNNTNNLKNQKALKKLMDDQLENLKTRDKLTQYDIDRAEKRLQLEQARIALEQAQSSKTSLRLKRDAQGNYSYQYVADEQGIEDAQQEYLDSLHDWQSLDKDQSQQLSDEILRIRQQLKEKILQIQEQEVGNDQRKNERIALAWEYYGEKINNLEQQYATVRNNLRESTFANYAELYNVDVDNIRNMSDDQQDIIMNDLVPTWNSGIAEMMKTVAGQGGFIPATQDAFEKLHQATNDYEEELEQMAEIAGISLDDVAEGTDELTDEFSGLVEENDQLIERMITELDHINNLKTAAHELKEQYKDVTTAAKEMVNQIKDVIQNEREQAAAYTETGNSYEQMTDTIYQAAANLQARLAALSAAYQPSGDNGSSGQGSNGLGSGSQNPSNTQKKSNNNNFDYYKFKDSQVYQRMATGGYTGDWATDEGRVAMLDKKQLVLNQDDTKNFLSGISILRQIAGNFKGGLQAKMSNIKSGFGMFNNQSDTIEQNVKIEASFPNVNSKQQIEDAFNNLVNLAAQRAMRR